MVDIKAALRKARGTGAAASPRGRAIVEVESFDTDKNTATGTIIDGMGKGEKITLQLAGHLTAKDYTKGKYKVSTGGSLQVEGLQKADGSDVYKTRWVKTFQAKPEIGHTLHTGQMHALKVITSRDDKGNLRRRGNVDILDMEGETHVTDITQLRKAMIDAVDKTGAVTIMTVTPGGDPVVNSYYARAVKQDDGSYSRESGEARIAMLEERLKSNSNVTLEDLFADVMAGPGISVLPTTSLQIGGDTWKMVEKYIDEGGQGGPINPMAFKLASPGARLANAYARLDVEADRAAVVKAFLDSANEDAKARFHEKGFAAVEPRDIRAFLESRNLKLVDIDTDTPGYVSGSILTLPFDKEKPENGSMVTKSFNITAPTPLPPVKAFEEIRSTYYSEMLDGLKSIAEAELGTGKTAEKADEKGKPASTAPASDKAPAAEMEPADEIDIDDIDDLITDLEASAEHEGIDP